MLSAQQLQAMRNALALLESLPDSSLEKGKEKIEEAHCIIDELKRAIAQAGGRAS